MYDVEYDTFCVNIVFLGMAMTNILREHYYCCVVHLVVVIHMCCYMSVCNLAAIGHIINSV